MKHLYLFGLLFSLPFCGFSQGEFNIWHFGNKAGLSFNTGFPVSFGSSQLIHTGPTTSISDSLGNILFYSNGWDVYNRNNVVMPNGSIGGGGCSTNYDQMNLGVKQINNLQRYYLFTAGCYQPGPSNAILRYSVVDMTLDGGNGAVVAGINGIPLQGGYRAYGSVTGTRHQNNRDAWVVVRLQDTDSNYYASYLVDPAGLSFVPVLSNSGIQMFTPPNMTFQVSNMRISKDGSRLVANYDSIAEVCQFNDATGQVSPLFHFHLPLIMGVPIGVNMVEFSLDSKLLYVSGRSRWAPVHGFLYQFDVTKTDSAQFVQSGVLLDSITGGMGHALQMAPDWKIYVSNPIINDTLSVINNPSVQGIGCNFQKGVVDVKSFDGGTGFPQFVERYYAVINDSGHCQNQAFHFTPAIWPPADSIHWDFGDPGSGINNFSNIQNPSHLYPASGPFTVHLFVRHNDSRIDSATKTIFVFYTPQPLLGPDQIICNGDSLTLDAGLFGGVTYQWADLTLGQFNIGNGQTYKTNVPDTYMVTVTDYDGCAGMDTIRLYPPPHVTNIPLFKSICSGESTAIPLTSDVPGTNFHWTPGLTSGNITGFSADSGLVINQVLTNLLPTPGVVTYHITPKTGSCPGIPVDFAVTVNSPDSVKVSISSSSNNICAGTSITFTANPTNPGSTPVYQWKVNGINSGTNSTTYSYTPLNGDVVTCILTSSNTICITNNPATSNSITMIVNPILPVSIVITASQNPVCSGTTVTFTANSVNGGISPSYQWKVNGINAGNNSLNYTYIPANGDMVSCVLTSSEQCTSSNPASSTQILMVVNPNLPVTVSIVASANPFCQGNSITFTATPANGGTTPFYQWKVNSSNAGTNNPNFTYSPANGDLVYCILTSSEICTSNNPASSISITMTQINSLPAGVSIAASSNPFCPGSSVTFIAAPSNGGTTPVYQWKVNGINVGINSSTFTYNPANNDSVRCIMTSNLSCVTGNPSSSAKIIMSGTLAPIVSFASCFDTITTINAKPIKLKGGIPLGGTYSGPGVNSLTGVFTPALAGVGTHTITYTYMNAALCSASKSISILNLPSSIFSCGNPLTDIRDNKVYQTVQIGSQCWLASNLNYGTTIASSQDQRDNCLVEKYCYNDNPINCTNHGGLYQWDELMQFDETPADQGFCPPGWHIPTENEWNTLFANYINNAFAGSPLKYSGYSGFNALLSGARHINKSWTFQGFAAFFWSSTPRSSLQAWAHGMNEDDPSVSIYPSSRANAFSVRCLKD